MTIRFEVYSFEKTAVHTFLGCHTIYLRDHKDLLEANGKWVEFPSLVLKRRTSKDKVSGRLHVGIRCMTTDEVDRIKQVLEKPKKNIGEFVVPTTDARKTRVGGIGITDGQPKVDRATHFTINPQNGDSDDWKVEHIGPNGEVFPVDIVENDDGTYTVNYTPEEAGLHHFNILMNGQPISDEPFDVNIMDTANEDESEVCGPLNPDDVHNVDDPVNVRVVARNKDGSPLDVGGDEVTCEVDGPSDCAPQVRDNKDGTYDIAWNPATIGKYKMQLKLNGKPITRQPYELDVQAKIEPNACTFVDSPPPTVGKEAEITVQAKDKDDQPINAGGEHFDVEVCGPDGQPVDSFVRDNGDGTYSALFVPIQGGKHTVRMNVNHKALPKHEVYCYLDTDPYLSKIDGPGLKGGDLRSGNGIPCNFVLTAKDYSGCDVKHGGDPFTCEVDGPDNTKRYVPPLDNGNGTYTFEYVPEKPGLHNMTFKLGGIPMRDAPLQIPITDGFDPKRSHFVGKGLEKLYRDIPKTVLLQANDPYGNPLQSGGADLDMDAVDYKGDKISTKKGYYKGNGLYPVTFTPKELGLVELKLKSNHQPIPGKVFYAYCEDASHAPDPVQCLVDGPPQGSMQVGVPSLFKVTLKDKNGDQLKSGDDDVEVLVNGPNNKPVAEPVNPLDLQDGTYNIEFTPKEPGKYTIDVKVLGQSIKGLPLTEVAAPGNLEGDAFISSRSIDIRLRDECGNPIENEVEIDKIDVNFQLANGEATNDVIYKRKLIGSGICRIKYQTLKQGDYLINVLVDKEHIVGSPFKVSVKG